MEVKKVAEEQKIWDEGEKAAKLQENWFLKDSTSRSMSLERK